MTRRDLDGSRIALTGATGFIGGVLLPRLLSAGASVVALTRRPAESGPLSHRRLSWASWDLEDPDRTGSALRGIDSVCHLAAYIPDDLNDPTEAEPCLRRNALGTLGLLQAARAAGVQYFVHVSTGQMYAPAREPASEGDVVRPSSRATYYLTSKLAAEIFVDHYGREPELSTVNLRLGSVYGPGMSEKSAVHRFIRRVLEGRPIELHGGGRYAVDLVFVEDVVSLVLEALRKRPEGALNGGSGKATSMEELAREIVEQCDGDPRSIRYAPGTADPGFAPLAIDKARRELGYSPTPLVEGISRTIAAIAGEPESSHVHSVTARQGC